MSTLPRLSLVLVAAGVALTLAPPVSAVDSGRTGSFGWPATPDLQEFAGYRATSDDTSSAVVIRVPDADSCDEPEISIAHSFMGLESESSWIAGSIAAICEPGQPGFYVAALRSADGTVIDLPAPEANDMIWFRISDNGRKTKLEARNLSAGGKANLRVPSVPGFYDVGTQVVAPAPLPADGVTFSKALLDGERLGRARPDKITYTAESGLTYKPSRLDQGIGFRVTSR